jgi:hypothetical protein
VFFWGAFSLLTISLFDDKVLLVSITMTISRASLPIYSLEENIESPNTVPKLLQTTLAVQHFVCHDRSSTTSTSTGPLLGQRRLRFAKYDEVFEIPHIDDLSEEEAGSVWMSRGELKEIRKRARETVSLIDDPNFGGALTSRRRGGGGLCIRGLDQHTPSYNKKRDAAQNLTYDIVFQLKRFHDVVDVHGLIAGLCGKCSSPSVAAAIQRAKIDAREAKNE